MSKVYGRVRIVSGFYVGIRIRVWCGIVVGPVLKLGIWFVGNYLEAFVTGAHAVHPKKKFGCG